jgi:PAP2 superfamily
MFLTYCRVLAASLLCIGLTVARADVVTDWNVIAQDVSESSLPQPTNRALAITHAAMFDAINAVTRTHTPYLIQPKTPADTSPEAAAISAAHDVLAWLYPNQRAMLDVARKTSLAKLPDGQSKGEGVALGQQVAEKYIAVRSSDGADRKVDYTPSSDKGKWRPTPPANQAFVSAFWADVVPFVLKSPTEVAAPGPLPLDSPQYAKEIDEVRRLGARDSKERTADQTAAAIFSLIKGSIVWNAAARASATAQGTSVIENARIFALLNMAMMDSTIAGWAVKKQYPLWRPITAIREAAVNPDPNWEPLLITPSHPDYLSGHCITSGAAAKTLALLFGNDGVKFSGTFGGGFGLSRSYPGFAAFEKEVENARVWAGIHTRTADEHGSLMGHQIAELVVQRAMRPLSNK